MNNEIYKNLKHYEKIKKRYEYECGMCGKDIMDMMFGPHYQIGNYENGTLKRICEPCHESFRPQGETNEE